MQNRSLVRAVDILSLIGDSREGLTLNEVVERTGIPKTTAYEILQMLQETKMIRAEEGRVRSYKVGLKAFLIGNQYLQNMDLITAARPVVDRTRDLLQMTVFIALLDGNQIVYIHKAEPQNVPIYTAGVSTREDLYCTSLGKAILSALPEEEQDRLIATQSFESRTDRTIADPAGLKADLRLIHERGYSLDDREILDFVMCVGAPILNHHGLVEAAVSAAGLYRRERDSTEEGRIILQAAREISEHLGYTGTYYRNCLGYEAPLKGETI